MIEYEKDLYEPVKRLFEKNGYEVKGEVKNCDIIAVNDKELVVCELKLSFNLKLVYQLLDRKALSSAVYAAVVTPSKNKRSIKKLMKEIDCGLIFVSKETEIAEVVLNPEVMTKRTGRAAAKVRREFDNRSFDNTGGVSGTKLMTAYKEKSIRLLCYMELLGEASPLQLKRLGLGDVGRILYDNYYGWFSHIKKGVYGLSEKGKSALEYKGFSQQVEYFRREREEKNVQIIQK